MPARSVSWVLVLGIMALLAAGCGIGREPDAEIVLPPTASAVLETVPTEALTTALATFDPWPPTTIPPTPAPSPTPLPPGTSFPDEPSPTTPPLPVPLTADEALAKALDIHHHIVTYPAASDDELAAVATVALYDSRAAADAALGGQSGYAPEVEADAGQVWLISFPGPVWNLIAPGGGFAPWAVWDGIAYQISARTGAFLGMSTGPGLPGLALLLARDDDLYRADAQGRVVERLTEGGALGWGMAAGGDWWIKAKSLPPAVSPDGHRIALSPDGRRVTLVAVGDPKSLEPLAPGSSIFAWSPDSRLLAYVAREDGAAVDQLMIYDTYKATAAPLMAEGAPEITSLAWSPDGFRVAFGCCFEDGDSAAGEPGTAGGRLRVAYLGGQVSTVGALWRSVAGGTQTFCWTEDRQVKPIEGAAGATGHCSSPPDRNVSPDGQRRFDVFIPPQPDPAVETVYQLVVEGPASGETWRRDLPAGLWPIAWAPDGDYLLLDDTLSHSPIWRLRADGTGDLEVVIADGYLLDVVAVWQ